MASEIIDQESYLLNIPVEVFLHICSFLDSKHSLRTLSKVCKQLEKILDDDFIWKSKIGRRWSPYIENENVDWRLACDSIECEAGFLHPETLTNLYRPQAHTNDIHAVHIVEVRSAPYLVKIGNKLTNGGAHCLTGSREHDIKVWKMDGIDPEIEFSNAHNGWVWRFVSSSPTDVFSCSFDQTVKYWQLTPGTFQIISTYECSRGVVSLEVCKERHLIAAGLTKGVVLFDYRAGPGPVYNFCSNKNTVLALAATGPDSLIATGLDRTLTMCDLRAGREFDAKFTICDLRGHPQCMTMQRGLLYVGDTEGQIHMIDLPCGEPRLLKSYNVGEKENFLAMSSSYTTIVTASKNGNIRFWRHRLPSMDSSFRELETVGLLQPKQEELCSMHFRDDVVAASLTRNNAFNRWFPAKSGHSV